ncbi:hypothetical protein VE00_09668 [Pseudogymnoascus sp. WSF 3629]|nr:hypothetical protein VE00_09668 [Pseudogymnoascus sp. WSF 3629]
MDSPSLVREMPLEVFLQVSSYLTTPDLCALRRTCKRTEAWLFDTFSLEFFTRKQFMLTETSLQALIDISNHPTLSQCLRHVIIGLDNYDYSGRPLPHFSQDAQANRYRAGLANQFTLLSTGQDRDMLACAFRNLPNLQTVGLRDYSSGGRIRDSGQWHSYGATTIFEETGVRLAGGYRQGAIDTDLRYASRAFSSVLYALGQSSARPAAFEVLLKKRGFGLRDYAFNIPNFLEPSVVPVLASLKTLLLGVSLANESIFDTPGANNSPDLESRDFRFRQFFHHTPNLTHLRLNFQNVETSNDEDFLVWLSHPALHPASPAPIVLSQLRRLDIGMLSVAPHVLLDVIRKFQPTLRELSLWKITLKSTDQDRRRGKRVNVWAKFFAKLSDLDHLSVGCLSQLSQQEQQQVGFRPVDSQEDAWRISRDYSRDDMLDFPHNLVRDVLLEWPEGGDGEDESMSDDTSDDYDNDTDMDDDE